MTRFFIKVLLSAFLIAGISELGKRSSFMAAILASLPLTSILAISWLYWDTQDKAQVIALSHGIFWAVLPSLLFFIVLPLLLKAGLHFAYAMTASCAIMALSYSVYAWVMHRFGIKF